MGNQFDSSKNYKNKKNTNNNDFNTNPEIFTEAASKELLPLGKVIPLKVLRKVDFGAYLDGKSEGEILLPLRYLPKSTDVGDVLDVLVHFDSEDRLIATTETPLVQVDEISTLKVVAVEKVGAFLDWGLSKDLMLPYAEQTMELEVGDEVVIYCYLDKTDRLAASMRIEKFLRKQASTNNSVLKNSTIQNQVLKENQAVDLQIIDKTKLGYLALINNNQAVGVLFFSEVFQNLNYGQKIKGSIRQIRPDGKINLGLSLSGHHGGLELEPKILKALQEQNGFLPFTDKTAAEIIYKEFQASKKKFKIAIGGLYKKRIITIAEDGLHLNKDYVSQKSDSH